MRRKKNCEVIILVMKNEEFFEAIKKVRGELNLLLAMSDLKNRDESLINSIREAVQVFAQEAETHGIKQVEHLSRVANKVLDALESLESDEEYSSGMSHFLKLHEVLEDELNLYQSTESFGDSFEEGISSIESQLSGGLENADSPASSSAITEQPSGGLSAFIYELPSDMVEDDLLSSFIEEAGDSLEEVEKDLMLLEKDNSDQELVNTIFRSMHTIKGTSGFIGLDVLGKVAHKAEDLLSQVREGCIVVNSDIIDCVLMSCDCLKQMLQQLDILINAGGDKSSAAPIDVALVLENLDRVNKLVPGEGGTVGSVQPQPAQEIESPDADEGDLQSEESAQEIEKPPGVIEKAEKDTAVVPKEPENLPSGSSALKQQEKPNEKSQNKAVSQADTGIRKTDIIKVPAGKLDEVSELVGELVVAFSIFSQNEDINSIKNREVTERITQMEKITEALRDRVLDMRMLPLDSVFVRLERQVRDLTKGTDKQVDLIIKGRDTLLDKSLIDEIYSPLMHLIRNAIDHGLETTEERKAAGKIPESTLMIKAYHKGDNIQIEVFDDGRGLDKKRIREKAVDKGLIKKEDTLSDKDIFEFIMNPGFSTARKITDISGRGVGMDVVKKGVEGLMGRIIIESVSTEWTRFTMVLPLSTSIITGLVVKIGGSKFVVPLLSVKQTLKPVRESIKSIHDYDGEVFLLNGELIPVLRLYEFYNIQNACTDPSEGILIIVEQDGKKYGILVDELLHRQQIVIKRLSGQLAEIDGISGGTILGNGQISFVLAMDKIIKSINDNRVGKKVMV